MDELKARAKALGDDVEALTESVDRLAERQTKTEQNNRALVVALLLVVALGGFVGYVAFRAERAIDDGIAVRQDVLCPVFDLVVGGYDPESRPAGPARETYIENQRVMREARDSLDCRGDLVPRRTG
ncbi:hypothetical protein [Pseudonocardia broussonetiae]|uniref:Uncharacterized protein n=1 Tax=Pseudonocardia broussonetiae TaxID=2736640 RepID=A0A6M6JHI3_9PSEU|nr:hypothetical protein [Pseudonocardia broussonetiae]QJY46643.1 hypothetical protein HOP40_13135 [Pseudonocardia broussonetiae]